MTDIAVKICGLREAAHVRAAVEAGASLVGFNFYDKSPRFLTVDAARDLALAVPAGVAKVAVTVNASDGVLEDILARVPIDMLQLHGSETPDRVAQVREHFGLPVLKAVGLSDAGDLAALDAHARVADQILVDAKPPTDGSLPGGRGVAFDWRLIAGRRWTRPWLLAGGLTADNVAQAIRLTGARQVDVSSGVESAPGVKDEARITAFVNAATDQRA